MKAREWQSDHRKGGMGAKTGRSCANDDGNDGGGQLGAVGGEDGAREVGNIDGEAQGADAGT